VGIGTFVAKFSGCMTNYIKTTTNLCVPSCWK